MMDSGTRLVDLGPACSSCGVDAGPDHKTTVGHGPLCWLCRRRSYYAADFVGVFLLHCAGVEDPLSHLSKMTRETMDYTTLGMIPPSEWWT